MALRDVFTARAIATAWDNYNASLGLAPYLGRSFFGTQKKIGLDLAWITGEDGMPVALKGANFDANAPLRDGIGFSKIEQGMPFFRESIMVSEQDEQDYMTFEDANPEMARQILARIMKSPLGLIQGADVVPERMIWQLMAPADGIPKIVVTVDGGDTYTVNYTADNGVAYKAKNYSSLSGTALWSAAATATPIADIQAMIEKHEANYGVGLGAIIMNQATWKQFVNADDTKKQVMGILAYQNGMMVRDNDVKQFMLSNYGVNILVYNKLYVNEQSQTVPFVPNGVVVGIAAGTTTLGDVWYGTTPEERSGDLSIGNLALVNTGVSVYTYTTPHPVNTHSVVSEIVLPSYERMNSVAIMKVIA